MNPRFIGFAPSRIFCVIHEPANSVGKRDAVLFCPPVGAEYLRTHRMFRQLAESLALAGHTCMRFDYSGLGDSQGEFHHATLDDWIEDTNDATIELMSESLADRVMIIGCRLGATIGYLTAEREGLPVSQMIMIDPVVDGKRYLAELRATHREKLRRWRSKRQSTKNDQVEELLGYTYSTKLLSQLEELTLHAPASSMIQPSRHVLLSQAAKRSSDLFDRWIQQSNASLHTFNAPCYWDRFEYLERQLNSKHITDAISHMVAESRSAEVKQQAMVTV